MALVDRNGKPLTKKEIYRLRGRLYFKNFGGRLVAAKWPSPRKKPLTPLQQAWVDNFAAIAGLSKAPDSCALPLATQLAQGKGYDPNASPNQTGWYYRDVIETALSGKLIRYLGAPRITTPTAKVHNTATQSIPSGGDIILNANTVDWDNNNWWDVGTPSRLTCRSSGLYLVVAEVSWSSSSTARRLFAKLYRNGVQVKQTVLYTNTISGGCQLEISALLYLNTGDYIQLAQASSVFTITCQMAEFSVVGITPEVVGA